MLNKIEWLDNLGRVSRHKKNTKLENFMTELQRLTLVHEGHRGAEGSGGSEYYRFAPGAPSKPDAAGDGDQSGKAKSSQTNKKKDSAKDADGKDSKETVQDGGERPKGTGTGTGVGTGAGGRDDSPPGDTASSTDVDEGGANGRATNDDTE